MKIICSYSVDGASSKENKKNLELAVESSLEQVASALLDAIGVKRSDVENLIVFYENEVKDNGAILRTIVGNVNVAHLFIRILTKKANSSSSSSSSSKEILYDYVSLETLNEEFLCGICCEPAVEPVITEG